MFAFDYFGFVGMSWFEIGMLVCFGMSWPFSIYKMLVTKSSEGKSYLFLSFVLTGYGCGILNKLVYHCDVVVFLYIFNFLIVFADMLLCLHYQKAKK
ncbi:MAG: hypothetical protein LBJ67_08655 [Planctomycetaceae bacterium]|jgi:hypothetical protein|nr:hypothetical protein [Planctomycetaceae bacterium]